MDAARRLPNLTLPFALVGAAAGWLSAGLLSHPFLNISYYGVKPLATVCSSIIAGTAGAILTRLSYTKKRKRYAYELESPEEEATPKRGDSIRAQVLVMLLTGVVAGGLVTEFDAARQGAIYGAVSGFFCALGFLPVGLAVVAAARRSKRARLGSIVAGSDARAVWGILACTLGLVTLIATIDWPASKLEDTPTPTGVFYILGATALVTLGILVADMLAFRRASSLMALGLSPRENSEGDEEDPAAAKIDLGLGDDELSRLARGASAYRSRAKIIALVRGNPDQALLALRRGVRRGMLSLVLLCGVMGAHAFARTEPAELLYLSFRCERWWIPACSAVPGHEEPNPYPWRVSPMSQLESR